MIQEMKRIPVTGDSHPFGSAQFHCRLEELGYVEDEYFMSGTANVCEEKENRKPEVIFADAPYTTRLLIRRPADKAAFSGNVVIEVVNASAMMDIDRMWMNSWRYFTKHGDIFIGITSKGHVVDNLKKFDPERYAAINWANPMPEREAPKEKNMFQFLPQFESGLFWDMIVELARLLRTDSALNPIAEYGDAWLYLTGWSQSGGYLNRVIKSFAYRPEYAAEKPLFDGYLAGGSGMELAPMNAYQGRHGFGRSGIPTASVMGAKNPYIAVNTESENRHVNWQGDFDEPDYRFRTYQIAGSSHDSKYNLVDYYEGQGAVDNLKFGMVSQFEGVDGEALDFPYEYTFNAAFHYLFRWVRDDVPAPHFPKIETEKTGPDRPEPLGSWVRNRTDAFGNAKGGIRLPAIEYPTATYVSFSTDKDGKVHPMFGTAYPLPPEVLKGLYGSLSHYRELVEESAKECAAKGYLLEEDRNACVERTVEQAKRRGLR